MEAATSRKRVYHLMMPFETITFLSAEDRELWLKKWGDDQTAPAESDVPDDVYATLQAWEGAEK